MLKDFALGQYVPLDTPAHRLDPRTKIILTILYIAAIFIANNVLSYALVFVALVAAIIVSKARVRAMLRGMKPLIFIVVLTGILNLFFTSGTVIAEFWIFRITEEGLRNAIFMVLRIIMLVMGTFLLTYTTSPIDLSDAIEKLLGPLKKIHVPVHELAMMMSIALRFIPTLVEETNKIMSAQKARGADFDSGNLIQKAKALLPLLVPLFVSAFRRADELAIAMESRCYHGGVGRTKMKQMRLVRRDMLAFLWAFLILGGIITLVVFGL